MKYLLVNPFNPSISNGIVSYYKGLVDTIGGDIDIVEFSNHKDEEIPAFQRSLLAFVQKNFARGEVIIEAPETRSATLLLDRGYKTHIRLHTPLAICHKYEGKVIGQPRFSEELRVIAQASAVSAPSYGIVREISNHLDTSDFIVNKNPIVKSIPYITKPRRKFDAIFMGRFNAMKGVEYLDAILDYFPNDFKVALVGSGATKFKMHNSSKVAFTAEHIEGDDRFNVLANAKVCMVPSLFENCSMMILEAIAAGVPVVAWQRGGNNEFPLDAVKTVEFDQINNFAGAVIEATRSVELSQARVGEIVNEINNDFIAGARNIIDRLRGNSLSLYRSNTTFTSAYKTKSNYRPSFEPEQFFSGKKVLGFSISNEHIEEMWAPVLNYLGVDYHFVCRRSLGFHSKFGKSYPVREGSFNQIDWVKHPDKLVEVISTYKPSILLTHNGSHPMYQHVFRKLKLFNLPIVFTELGWYPQNGNIYFDRWGVNGASSLASQSFAALTSQISTRQRRRNVKSRDVLIVGQLNNDTNIQVFSPRFRSMDSFVEHVVQQLAGTDRTIYIRPHPLDSNADRFAAFESGNVKISRSEESLKDLLSNVGHVFSINSTVLMEALQYDVNIYVAGLSLLDNKGVSKSLLSDNAATVITDEFVGSRKDREHVINAFKKKQVCIATITERSLIDEGQVDTAFSPIYEALLMSRPLWPALTPNSPSPGVVSPIASRPANQLTHTQLDKRGREHFHAKRYAQAAADFMSAALIPGSPPNILRAAAEAYYCAGETDKAIAALKKSAKLQTNKRLTKRISYLQRPRWMQAFTDPAEFEVRRP